MNRMKLATVVIVIVAVAVAGAILPHALAQAGSGMNHSGHNMGNMNMEQPKKAAVFSLEDIHSKHVPMVVMSIDKAKQALESGNKKAVLTELNKAREMLLAIDKSLATYVKTKFANDRCPIIGSPIDPDKVPENLIREYKGQKVAFCCAGCPEQWDKLTDAQKQAKLAKVMSAPSQMQPTNAH